MEIQKTQFWNLASSQSKLHPDYTITALYTLLVLLELLGELTHTYSLLLLKPLPILLLIFCSKKDTMQQKCIFWAFIFCIVGDLCLMSGQVLVFEIGAGSFLFAHLLYIRAFCYDI